MRCQRASCCILSSACLYVSDLQFLLSQDQASSDDAPLMLNDEVVVRALAAGVHLIIALVELRLGDLGHPGEVAEALDEALAVVTLLEWPDLVASGKGRHLVLCDEGCGEERGGCHGWDTQRVRLGGLRQVSRQVRRYVWNPARQINDALAQKTTARVCVAVATEGIVSGQRAVAWGLVGELGRLVMIVESGHGGRAALHLVSITWLSFSSFVYVVKSVRLLWIYSIRQMSEYIRTVVLCAYRCAS